MNILDSWPEEPKTPSQTDKVLPLLDGQIYEFTLDDAKEWGIDIGDAVWSEDNHSKEEDHKHWQEYRRAHALTNLKQKILGAVSHLKGSWQTRSKFTSDTWLFQFTGLRECRFKACTVKAILGGSGYCQNHYDTKKNEGKVK